MWYSIGGMVVALVGAYVGSTLPLMKMLQVAAGFGGGEDDEWKAFEKQVKWKSIIANVLLVVGTGLQIYGSIPK